MLAHGRQRLFEGLLFGCFFFGVGSQNVQIFGGFEMAKQPAAG